MLQFAFQHLLFYQGSTPEWINESVLLHPFPQQEDFKSEFTKRPIECFISTKLKSFSLSVLQVSRHASSS